MNKQYFAVRLIPSRSDFAQTMTDAERSIMQEHLAHWRGYMDRGNVVVFGPVMDPAGAYGLGIVAVEDEKDLHELMQNDPAASINRYEYYPMMAIVPAG